jgi:hypothetical protein
MAGIFTPTNWPNVLGPYRIDINDCMGDSVGIINANTNYLASFTAAVSTTAATQINSTVTTLSTVPYARLNAGNQTGPAPIYGCRAWVNFQGRESNGVCTIRNGGNVASVSRISDGRYQINFQINMLGTNYVVLGNASRNNNPSNKEDTSIMPYDLSESSFTISLLDATNNTVVNDSFIYLAVIA